MGIFKNYYQILGIEPSADFEAVKAAYRKLARQHHPDLNTEKAQAEEKFKEINEAYEILSDPQKRSMHDVTLQAIQGWGSPKPKAKKNPKPDNTPKNAQVQGQPDTKASNETGNPAQPKSSDSSPIEDLFGAFLKRGSQQSQSSRDKKDEGIFKTHRKEADGNHQNTQRQEKTARGEDVVVKTAINIQEASEGVIKTVNVQHNELCRRCSGTGKVNGVFCSACTGEKVLVRIKKIDVRIPAGVRNGSRVRVAKEGGRGSGGGENGDLFLQIELAYDPSLRIEGLDVYGEIGVSVTEVALGAEIDIPTLNGTVKMTIPAGTQTGKTFRLKERGVHSGLSKGDHFVTVVAVTPENLSEKEKALYQELAKLRPERPVLKKGK